MPETSWEGSIPLNVEKLIQSPYGLCLPFAGSGTPAYHLPTVVAVLLSHSSVVVLLNFLK